MRLARLGVLLASASLVVTMAGPVYADSLQPSSALGQIITLLVSIPQGATGSLAPAG
ncbi:hypothetical protein [Nonomuraea typhae]|uniref:Uncharacterized protein n=1 Tax=Nonomuraea typhae TaxID=2603600 RepID=A0ABW7YU67_9ACTN